MIPVLAGERFRGGGPPFASVIRDVRLLDPCSSSVNCYMLPEFNYKKGRVQTPPPLPVSTSANKHRYRDQIITRLHSVMWARLFCPRRIHYSCSTVMTLLCIPVSELVPSLFLQSFFHLLVSAFLFAPSK